MKKHYFLSENFSKKNIHNKKIIQNLHKILLVFLKTLKLNNLRGFQRVVEDIVVVNEAGLVKLIKERQIFLFPEKYKKWVIFC